MLYNIAVEFKDWITQKYVQYRGNAIGRERTVKEFAAWIGVSQPTMATWMTGKKAPRSHQSIKGLVARYGNEAYEILGLPAPEEEEEYIDIGPHTTEEVIDIILRLAAEHGLQVEIHRGKDPE